MMPILLDAGPSPKGISRLDKFWRCPRAFALGQHLKRLGKDDITTRMADGTGEPLIMGSIIHTANAHFYGQRGARQPNGVVVNGERVFDPTVLYSPEDAMTLLCAKNGWSKFLGPCIDIHRQYQRDHEHDRIEVLAVETVVWYRFGWADVDGRAEDVPLGSIIPGTSRFPRYDESARIDLVFKVPNGKTYILDFKGVGQRKGSQPDYYSRSGQFQMLRWLGSELGAEFGGVLLERIQRTAPYTSDRPALIPVPHKAKHFPADVRWAEDRIWELEASGRPPDEWPATPSEVLCEHRYSTCEVAQYCDWGL